MRDTVYSAGTRLVQLAREVVACVADWIADSVRQCRTCRECDADVSALDTVCWRCGAASPARVPISSCFVLFAVPILGLLLYMCLTN